MIDWSVRLKLKYKYEQKIGYARGSLWAPFHAVGMVARIQGDVCTERVESALCKLEILYPPLAGRVQLEDDGSAWLTTEGVGKFPLEVRPRTSDDDWAKLFLEQEKIPFVFERGPLARFFLLRGHQCSDLIVIAPHVVCDGYSMTFVISDMVSLLNDPDRMMTPPPLPPVATWQTISHAPLDNLFLRSSIKVLNRLWPRSRAVLRQDEYEEICRCYWARRRNGLLAFELSPLETSDLLARCRQHGVSVTGALIAAFLLGQADIGSAGQTTRRKVKVAVNIRDRMIQSPGRVVGVYASNIDLTMRARPGTAFWELARESHTRLHKALNDRSRILWPLALGELDPLITDTFLAALSTDRWDRQLGLFTRFVRMGGLAPDLDVSNIGRIDLPELDTPHRLETFLPLPPLMPGSRIALNVLTVDGRMNVILKFQLDQLDSAAVSTIKDRALSYLSGA